MKMRDLMEAKSGRSGAYGTVRFEYKTRKASTWFVTVTALIPLPSGGRGKFMLPDLEKWSSEASRAVKAGYESVDAVVNRIVDRSKAAYGVKVHRGKVEDDFMSIVGKNVVFKYEVTLESDGEIDPARAEMVAAALSSDVKNGYDFKYQNIN